MIHLNVYLLNARSRGFPKIPQRFNSTSFWGVFVTESRDGYVLNRILTGCLISDHIRLTAPHTGLRLSEIFLLGNGQWNRIFRGGGLFCFVFFGFFFGFFCFFFVFCFNVWISSHSNMKSLDNKNELWQTGIFVIKASLTLSVWFVKVLSLLVVLRPVREYFTHMETSHLATMSWKIKTSSKSLTFEQGGISIVSHQVWHDLGFCSLIRMQKFRPAFDINGLWARSDIYRFTIVPTIAVLKRQNTGNTRKQI